MEFTTAQCRLCLQIFYNAHEVVAFKVRATGIEIVELRGKQPDSGTRCVCKTCAAVLVKHATAVHKA